METKHWVTIGLLIVVGLVIYYYQRNGLTFQNPLASPQTTAQGG